MARTQKPAPASVDGTRQVHARVRELLAAADAAKTVAEARPSVLELCRLLPTHFDDEETGLFRDVVLARPEAGDRIEAFVRQHSALRGQADSVVSTMPDDGVVLSTASTAIAPFLAALREHEKAESELLFDVWQGGDSGTGD